MTSKFFKIKKILFFFGILQILLITVVYTQNLAKTKERVKILSSPEFHGRGYLFDASEKAANYIADELKKANVIYFGESYFQIFSYNVNTFPKDIKIKLDNKKLIPGKDFLIGPSSPSTNKNFELFLPDSILLNDTLKFEELIKSNNFNNKALVIDYIKTNSIDIKKFYINKMLYNKHFGCIIELIPDELMWSVSKFVQSYPVVKIKRENFNFKAKKFYVNVKSEYKQNYIAKNVIGFIPGETSEFIVFSAHYDHLGRMGKKVYIPGAQDNASGVATLLDLADYYSKTKPYYSIAFMFFFGEEAGLIGSKYYVQNPLFPLKNIKFLINLDLVGTGDEGITIVNAAEEKYQKYWKLFNEINDNKQYFSIIKARGESPNSDHYPFNAKGIDAIFIYTMGGKTYYHSPKDKPETLTFSGYNNLFKLLLDFIEKLETE